MFSGFELRNLCSSFFWITTIFFAFASWLTAMISGGFFAIPNFIIWNLVFLLLVIVGMIVMVGCDVIRLYRHAMLTFCAVGFVYATWNVEFVYSEAAAGKAIGVSFVVLAFVISLWIFVLGAEHDSSLSEKFSRIGVKSPMIGASYMTSSNRMSSLKNMPWMQGGTIARPVSPAAAAAAAGGHDAFRVDVSPDAEYSYKAQALYSYSASPEDPNELSFTKGEVLAIVDNKGKWWQARKQDGSIGIVPSNYFRIV